MQRDHCAFVIEPWTYKLRGDNITLSKGTKVHIKASQTQSVSVFIFKQECKHDNIIGNREL